MERDAPSDGRSVLAFAFYIVTRYTSPHAPLTGPPPRLSRPGGVPLSAAPLRALQRPGRARRRHRAAAASAPARDQGDAGGRRTDDGRPRRAPADPPPQRGRAGRSYGGARAPPPGARRRRPASGAPRTHRAR